MTQHQDGHLVLPHVPASPRSLQIFRLKYPLNTREGPGRRFRRSEALLSTWWRAKNSSLRRFRDGFTERRMPPTHQRLRASPPNFAVNSPQILDAIRRRQTLLGRAPRRLQGPLLPRASSLPPAVRPPASETWVTSPKRTDTEPRTGTRPSCTSPTLPGRPARARILGRCPPAPAGPGRLTDPTTGNRRPDAQQKVNDPTKVLAGQ